MGFFREGGIGMTIILVYMLCMLVVGWGFAIWQIVSLVLWRKKTAKLEDIASKRDAAELAEHLTGGKGKAPGDAAGAALVLACDRVRDDKAPRDILAEVRELLATRMAGVHPAKGVLSALVLLGAVVVPVTLGVLFQVVGLI